MTPEEIQTKIDDIKAGLLTVGSAGGSGLILPLVDLIEDVNDNEGMTGDFVGPDSATDNAVVRFNGTTGKSGQNSLMTVDDSGSVNIPAGQSYKVNDVAIGGNPAITSVSANTTLNATYGTVQVNASGAPKTITLPAGGSNPGKIFTIVKTDSSANGVTLAGTINGVTNYTIVDQWAAIQVQDNGTDYTIIGGY